MARSIRFLQSDGKIVVGVRANHASAPEFALVRLTQDGKLDETFSDRGKTRISLLKQSELFGMALLPDGYALLVGSAGDGKSSSFALTRVRL